MTTEQRLDYLRKRLYEVHDLYRASSLAGWDMQTYMPPSGAQERSEMLSTLAALAHERATAPEVGELLEQLEADSKDLDPDSDDARLIKVSAREYKKSVRVPRDWVSEFALVTGQAHELWARARAESNFEIFRSILERIVQLRREYASLFAPYDHVYDVLLDDYEPGMKTTEVQEIFNTLREQQVQLVREIGSRPQIDDSFLHLEYNRQAQWDFGVEVVTRFGYDWKRGRQDYSAHPFTTSFGIDDVRITTRILPDMPSSGWFSTMHEGGHALYDQGIDKALRRTPLANGASLAVHESQSRMFENLIGRSLPFWRHFYPLFQRCFSEQVKGIDLETFYRAINRVQPSFIRVEADEATYNLHIMLRMELEIALMEGGLEVKDLPEAWNSRMQEYLGITPPDDARGVLQDVHWSGGSIGYFPTYALGNLISVQLWERINQDIPDLSAQIERGEFAPLLDWLRQNVHRHGAKYEPQELVERVTGSRINAQPYLGYLREKYSEIYNL